MDVERELSALRIDWPRTPAFSYAPRRRRRPLFAAAIALAAVAVAFAVPQSRGAILRFFDIGSVHVRVVDTLPRASERPLSAGLGPTVPLAVAKSLFPGLLLPRVNAPLHLAPGKVLSVIFQRRGHPVLLSEYAGGYYVKKLVGGSTRIEQVTLRGSEIALWLSGKQHVFDAPRRSPRLAGDVLIWSSGDRTYRLEGPDLRKEDAILLARSLRRG